MNYEFLLQGGVVLQRYKDTNFFYIYQMNYKDNLSKYGQIKTNMDKCGHLRTNTDIALRTCIIFAK